MDNKLIKAVVFENVEKMLLMGLQGAPFISGDDARDIAMEVWVEALTDAKFNDSHANTVGKCWRAMRRQAVRWFTPAQLIASIRSLPRNPQKALPNMSDEQIAENKIRLAKLMGTLSIGSKSH